MAQSWCPLYHASRGQDPSGAIILDGQTFIFPVGNTNDDPQSGPHHWGSADLLHWTRFPMGWEADTGSISRTSTGTFRHWPQGGLAGPIACATLQQNDSTLSQWAGHALVIPVPSRADGRLVTNFRDPSRAVRLADGSWYLAVGSDDGSGSSPGLTTDGVAALRLYRASTTSLCGLWEDEGAIYVVNATLGYVNWTLGEFTPRPVARPPYMECPDLYEQDGVLVLISSFEVMGTSSGFAQGEGGMSAEWRTGTILRGGGGRLQFATRRAGVLDHGAFYAMKTAASAVSPAVGRRLLFGWLRELCDGAPGCSGRGAFVKTHCGVFHAMPRDLSVGSDGTVLISPGECNVSATHLFIALDVTYSHSARLTSIISPHGYSTGDPAAPVGARATSPNAR